MKDRASDFIAVVDVETTGLSPWRNDRIVEIAVLVMSADGNVRHEYHTLVNPDRDMGPTHLHRITAAEVLYAPKFSDIADDVLELLSQTRILAGHNVSFDRNFLIKEFERSGFAFPETPLLCTCQLFGRNSLAACCQEYKIEIDGDAHCAVTDARATAALIRQLINDEPALLSEFNSATVNWPCSKPKRTPSVTREIAKQKIAEPPRFLQRIRSRVRHDVEATAPDVLSYLALIDRVLEDRRIDQNEENVLVDAATNWHLSSIQVEDAHRVYINNLAVHALADGVVTDVERADLHHVSKLLGQDDSQLDQILKIASAQLSSANPVLKFSGTGNELAGKSVCFTGELQSRLNGECISREVAETLAEKAGLIVAGGVTKKLDVLVVADPNTQSGKAKKARQYGTRILAESVLWKMIGVTVD
jgi:DNA polymerase III subunit epsilon